ncbi:hypothetical protein [Amphiplicatus metriothermophilus]|uniref:Peptidase M10 metallopeptidase domain-containing protein n=1 Tax=Amphiplicatus metriothermophilus TaxID=1519374 RepID=A0A239Q0V9_9PROT|nr:hypothetical protein [Amphiplicatus metriothermophilus]MBB5520054.1 hypothetical protein [Amphiplicatus metriothermophilus]SNT75832.1 hypothetical protein SAMN06297382_2926 [Amphiplicatus metriothermophilus]
MKQLLAALLGATAMTAAAQAEDISAFVEAANAQLLAAGHNVQIGMVEWINDGESEQMGQTLLFKDVGNKQLGFDFVPGDPRRGGRTDIRHRTDGTQPSADAVDTFGAIGSAMQTWQDVSCSNIPLTDLGLTSGDIGFIQSLIPGFGGNPNIAEPIIAGADITHAGVLPGAWFDAAFGPNSILGVAFTIMFVDGAGNPTDIDNNGTNDAAYREIYYNDAFVWVNDPNDGPGNGVIDLESVALHEAGHGLSQAHFGNAAIINANGKIRISPKAVMNAGYIFAQQDLQGSDIGGHCSNWSSWPTN